MSHKAGFLCNPSLYDGARSKAVYARRSGGHFFLLDGVRTAVGGTQRWTTLQGVPMRGNVEDEAPRPRRGASSGEKRSGSRD